jgi:hypothetical protein
MRYRLLFAGCILVSVSLLILGQTRDRGPASSAAARYRITSWPDHTGPDKNYGQEVEDHLNRMAAEGWRFHGDMVGQTVRMMVFERDR